MRSDELPKIPGPIDIAFIDGSDKLSSQNYFDLIWPKVRIGGSVLTDNTKTHPQDLAGYVQGLRTATTPPASTFP